LNERFNELFQDDAYLNLKNGLFSYQLRRRHLRPLVSGPASERILDLGCGISPTAPPAPNVVYVDISFEALRHLSRQHPQAGFLVADASRLPFKSGAVARLLCSEVLEHLEHDERTLQEMSRILQPGGHLVITVPIHRHYYTFDDAYVGHFRRYEVRDLLRMLEACGFRIVRVRKVAAVLEKAATYVMARTFAFLAQRQSSGDAGARPGPRWWFRPYRIANTAWSYVCWLESKVTPLALATIVSMECRKAVVASSEPAAAPVSGRRAASR